jgi:carbamoyltransferase
VIILGIADNHDSGAALVIDGQLVGAVNQERIDRTKNSSAFPWGAIDQLMTTHGVAYEDVDHIAFGSAFTPSAVLRLFPQLHSGAKSNGQFSPLLHGYLLYQSSLRKGKLQNLEINLCRQIALRKLKQRPFGQFTLSLLDHHQCHAEAAYRTQEKDSCLVLTLDAMGDGLSATTWRGENGTLHPLWNQSGLSAMSMFYSRVTEVLGYKPLRHEGKITGLAALAEAPQTLVSHFQQAVRFDNGRFNRVNIWSPSKENDAFWSKCSDYTPAEVASAAQLVFERNMCAFVEHWVEQTGLGDVVVGGGVFANVKMNQRLVELECVNSLWVLPHMGDGGLGAGAALKAAEAKPTALPNVYLGFEAPRTDVYKAVKRNNLTYTPIDLGRLADILCSGGVIARACGKMEWGPRALGNRSILAIPNDHRLNDRLNTRLQRTEFMPFAPLVRDVDVEKYFTNTEKVGPALRFMTVCTPTTKLFQQYCPAAVHVDWTARPQVLDRETSPDLYDLLTLIDKRIGHGVLINTSFNMHEEPIVCTANDAVRAFVASDLEGLWIGDSMVERD